MKIGESIKQLRLERGLTQLDLSRMSKIDRKTISRIENNKYAPQWNTLIKIFTALEIDMREFIVNPKNLN